MAKKLNAFEIKLLLEYRQYQDIKNLADKKCKQLQKQVYQLIDDKKLCEKENYEPIIKLHNEIKKECNFDFSGCSKNLNTKMLTTIKKTTRPKKTTVSDVLKLSTKYL